MLLGDSFRWNRGAARSCGHVRRPHSRLVRLEPLEDRRLLALTTYVNDDWRLLTDNAPAGLSIGDQVRNDFDSTDNVGTITALYGTTGFGSVRTLSDDFDDANDMDWTRYNPFGQFGFPATFSFPDSLAGGKGLRIVSNAIPGAVYSQAGPTRSGDARPEVFTNFQASVDLADWNNALDQSFGLLIRVVNVGLGTTNGYVVNYNTDGDFQINRITGEVPTTIAEVSLTLTAGVPYRMVALCDGPTITASMYLLADLTTPLASITVADGTYPSGQVGVFDYDNSDNSGGVGTADATFDNFDVRVALSGATTINDAIDTTDAGGTLTVLDGTYNETAVVASPITLAGSARINGSLELNGAGAVLSPGFDGPGTLIVDDLSVVSGAALRVQLNGLGAGGEYDEVQVLNTAIVDTAVLDASLGFSPPLGSEFQIVSTDELGSLFGEFAGLPEGKSLTIGGAQFKITYAGGDGNDIVLTRQGGVANRRVFYNNSSWDGNSAAAGPADDGAIATDKTALLPGQTATIANYTSYNKGINGVMVDISSPPGAVTVADFAFKVGNNNSPATWTPLGTAPTLSVRPGAGEGGSDRFTLVWPDSTILKQWLQVTVLANATTGLLANDVFYFGNAVGEAGNSAVDAQVNAADELAARGNPRNIANPAPITFLYDYNRDKQVNAADQLISRGNPTNLASRLILITPTPVAGGPGGGGLAAAADGLFADLGDTPDGRRKAILGR